MGWVVWAVVVFVCESGQECLRSGGQVDRWTGESRDGGIAEGWDCWANGSEVGGVTDAYSDILAVGGCTGDWRIRGSGDPFDPTHCDCLFSDTRCGRV